MVWCKTREEKRIGGLKGKPSLRFGFPGCICGIQHPRTVMQKCIPKLDLCFRSLPSSSLKDSSKIEQWAEFVGSIILSSLKNKLSSSWHTVLEYVCFINMREHTKTSAQQQGMLR